MKQNLIQTGLKLSTHDMLLPSVASNLAFAFGVPPGRILSGRFGIRRIYLSFIGIFIVGTLLNIFSFGLEKRRQTLSLSPFFIGFFCFCLIPDYKTDPNCQNGNNQKGDAIAGNQLVCFDPFSPEGAAECDEHEGPKKGSCIGILGKLLIRIPVYASQIGCYMAETRDEITEEKKNGPEFYKGLPGGIKLFFCQMQPRSISMDEGQTQFDP